MRDSTGRKIDTLRLSVTDRCNLRCVYCMSEEGVPLMEHSEILSVEETVALAGLLVGELGIRRIRVTGGEPLVRKGLPDIVRGLRSLDLDEISLTTNGLLLGGCAEELAASGVARVNVSLDSLRDERLRTLTRRDIRVEVVEEGIRAARNAGLAPVKINCVVLRGVNDDEPADFLRWAADRDLAVRFIEHMPAMLPGRYFVPASGILAAISGLGEVFRMEDGGGAESVYGIRGTGIRFGVIAPISEPMCGRCRRIRLTSDGVLMPCLASTGGIPLKPLLRRGSVREIADLARDAVLGKPASHGGCAGISMWKTGG